MALRQRHARHLLFAGAKHHAVDAVLAGRARLAKAGGHPRQIEQLNDDVLQHVAAPSAFLQALQKTTALADAAVVLNQRRQPRRQPLVKAGQLVGREIFQHPQVEPDFQHGAVSPNIGPTQVVDAQQFDIFDLCHGSQPVSESVQG